MAIFFLLIILLFFKFFFLDIISFSGINFPFLYFILFINFK